MSLPSNVFVLRLSEYNRVLVSYFVSDRSSILTVFLVPQALAPRRNRTKTVAVAPVAKFSRHTSYLAPPSPTIIIDIGTETTCYFFGQKWISCHCISPVYLIQNTPSRYNFAT